MNENKETILNTFHPNHFWKQSRTIEKVEFIVIILLFVTAVCVGVIKAEDATGGSNGFKTGIFFQWFSAIFIGGAGLLGAITHIVPFVRESHAISHGRDINDYQLEVGMMKLSLAVSIIIANVSFDYNTQFMVSIAWCLFSIMSGFKRSYEFSHGNHSLANVSYIWWDFIPSLILIITGTIGLNN